MCAFRTTHILKSSDLLLSITVVMKEDVLVYSERYVVLTRTTLWCHTGYVFCINMSWYSFTYTSICISCVYCISDKSSRCFRCGTGHGDRVPSRHKHVFKSPCHLSFFLSFSLPSLFSSFYSALQEPANWYQFPLIQLVHTMNLGLDDRKSIPGMGRVFPLTTTSRSALGPS
jgi:hypothetical protein